MGSGTSAASPIETAVPDRHIVQRTADGQCGPTGTRIPVTTGKKPDTERGEDDHLANVEASRVSQIFGQPGGQPRKVASTGEVIDHHQPEVVVVQKTRKVSSSPRTLLFSVARPAVM